MDGRMEEGNGFLQRFLSKVLSPFTGAEPSFATEEEWRNDFHSSLTQHSRQLSESSREVLFRGSYLEACRRARTDKKLLILCILSPVHEATETFTDEIFRRNPTFWEEFPNEKALLWFGNSRFPESYQLLRQFQVTGFPFLAFLSPSTESNRLKVVLRHAGPIPAERLSTLVQLWSAAHFCLLRSAEIAEAEIHQARNLREIQDQEYEAAVAADMRKQQMEREKQEKILRARLEAEEAERQEKELQEKAKDERRVKMASLPAEPPSSSEEDRQVVEIAIRLPNGGKLSRRFYEHQRISELCIFLEASENEEGEAVIRPELFQKYQICTSFPRKVLRREESFSDLRMGRKILLNLEILED